jgi:hypothetical protein
MTVEPPLKEFVVMFDSFSEKSPSIPLLLKGDVFLRGLFLLFFKEGLGEIFDCDNRERTKP